MFGIRLLPRIRNWKNLKLYRPRANARYRHLDALFCETVDWKLLRRHWKDWMQLVLSVQAGRIPASTLIRQLSHRSDVNTLSRFAEQLGNVDRTIFLLEWISNQPMRQQVTAMTNKVEGYHSFSKWLRFGGEVVAENDPDEQQKYLRYNDLLASAVILQNVIDMSQDHCGSPAGRVDDHRGGPLAPESICDSGREAFRRIRIGFRTTTGTLHPTNTLAAEKPTVEG